MFSNLGMGMDACMEGSLLGPRIVWLDRFYLVGLCCRGIRSLSVPHRRRLMVLGLEAMVWGGSSGFPLRTHLISELDLQCSVARPRPRAESAHCLFALLVSARAGTTTPASRFRAPRLSRFPFDASWWVIRTLERTKLVWNVKTPSGDQLHVVVCSRETS